MANQQNSYTGSQGTGTNSADFSFTFPSFTTGEVKVEVDNVVKTLTTHYTVENYNTTSGGTVRFTAGNIPTGTTPVRIFRQTDVDTAKATFTAGSSLKAGELNQNFKQLRHALQESIGANTTDRKIQPFNIEDGAITSAAIKDLAIARGDIANDAIDGTKIDDDSINSEHIVALSVDTGHIANENVTTAKIANLNVTTSKIADLNVTRGKLEPDAVDGTKLADNAVNSEHYVDGSIDHVHLANDVIDGDNIQDDAIDSEHYTDGSIDTAHIANNAVTAAKIADATIVTSGEQASHSVNNITFFTTAAAEARYFNINTGDTIKDGQTFPDNDTTIATTAAINDRIIDLVDDVGGFVPIANETSFPTANPDVNNGSGTLVSIKSISSSRTPSSGTVTIANGSGSNTVTITGCGSTVLAAGFGVIVETTSTLHTYAFHRLVPKATEVTTVASNTTEIGTVHTNINNINTVAGISSDVTAVKNIASDVTAVKNIASDVTAVANDATDIGIVAADGTDIGLVAGSINNVNTVAGSITSVNNAQANLTSINNFGDTYQVASSNPSTDGGGNALAVGDLFFDTSANELKVYNGSTWQAGITATSNNATLGSNTFTGAQVISTTAPSINFTDTDDDSDFKLILEDGLFRIQDVTNNFASRLTINSSGVVNITNHLDVANGIDVLDGNITMAAGHTVDGRDVSADGTKIDNAITSSGDLTVTNTDPAITLTDTQSNAYAFLDGNGGNLNIHADKGINSPSNVPSTLGFGVDGSIKMTLKDSGKLGIGTQSPGATLHLSSTLPELRFTDTDNNNIDHIISCSGSALTLKADENQEDNAGDSTVRFHIDTVERGRFNNQGLVATGNEHKFTAGNSGDLTLILEADPDNDTITDADEADPPKLLFKQDGGLEEAALFMLNNTFNIANTVASGGGLNLRTSSTDSGWLTAPIRMSITPSGQVDFSGNVDCNSGLDVTGALTMTDGSITQSNSSGSENSFGTNINISTVYPSLHLNDTNSENDFKVQNQNGLFAIQDADANSGSGSNRFTIASDGTTTVAQNLNVGTGIAVTGGIGVSTGNEAGLSIIDNSDSNHAPWIEVIGKRTGANDSQAFSGKLHLAINRTDAKIDTGKILGTVAFGGNHTDGSLSNNLYAASISGIASDSFDSATDMPTDLIFLTGSTGRAPNTPNVGMGEARMRIKADGNVGIGTNLIPTSIFHVRPLDETNFLIRNEGSTIVLASETNTGRDNNRGMALEATHFEFIEGGTEKVRIHSDGTVGIGTDNPQGNLHIKSTGDCVLVLEGDSGDFEGSEHRNPFIKFLQDGSVQNSVIGMNPFETSGENNSLVLANSSGSHGGIVFRTGETSGYTNAVKRMEINSNGTVDITNNLEVGGTGTFDSGLTVKDASGSDPTMQINHSDADVTGEFLRIGRTELATRYHSLKAKHGGAATSNLLSFHLHDGSGSPYTGQQEVLKLQGDKQVTIAGNLDVGAGVDVTGSSNLNGDVTVDNGTSTLLNVKCDDGGNAIGRAGGGESNGQGTGAFEVTQNNGSHGGGISYNGDNSPAFVSGETSDHVTFYRLSAGTREEVFHYPYNSNVVNFNSVPTVGGTSLVRTSDTIANATDAVNVTGTIASAVTATTQSANDNSTKIATTAYVDNASGGGGGGVTVKDEGSALSTTATTLNFTGQVTASGTGAEKTIDIPNSVRNFSTQQRSDSTIGKFCSITNIGFTIPEASALSASGNAYAGVISGSNYKRVKGMVDFTPANDDEVDLGSSSLRWKNVYTTDLHLSNKGHSNDVDGTWGNWTIQEGESDLFLKNNRSGKKYKFNLTEVA